MVQIGVPLLLPLQYTTQTPFKEAKKGGIFFPYISLKKKIPPFFPSLKGVRVLVLKRLWKVAWLDIFITFFRGFSYVIDFDTSFII